MVQIYENCDGGCQQRSVTLRETLKKANPYQKKIFCDKVVEYTVILRYKLISTMLKCSVAIATISWNPLIESERTRE